MYKVVMYDITTAPLGHQTPVGIPEPIKCETLEEAVMIADEKRDKFHRVYVSDQTSDEKIVRYVNGRIIV